MSFPRYPKYRDSGVEWLGEVPEHWQKTSLKYLADYQNGYPFKPDDWGTSGLPIVRISQLTGDTAPNYFAGTLDDRVRVDHGDLLFSWSATIDSFFWMNGPAWLNQHIFKVTPSEEAEKGFLFYLIKHVAPKLADFDAHGSTMRHIKKESLGERAYVPAPDEQRLISSFLDRETAKIDELVSEQQRLMELLKEKRQAVISHAVTKGLNPDAPMKPSGVEWLGEVPAHWDVRRLKFLVPGITVGIVVEPSKYYVDDGVPALRSLNVGVGVVKRDNMVFISEEANELHSKSKLRAGDLVAVRSGQPGTTAVIPPELDGANCVDLIIIRRPQLGSEWFLCWYLASESAIRQFSAGSEGAIQQHFNVSTAMDLVVPSPPAAEQQMIVAFIVTECESLDLLMSRAAEAISLLEERRSALISAAVTGQIDVRHLATAESA